MKYFLAAMVFVFLGQVSFAQTDSANATPPSPEPPGTQQHPAAENQKEDRVEIPKEKLPSAMLEELDNNPRYEGWEEGNVFYERNTGQFIVHVKRDNTTQTFRFDKEGRSLKSNENLVVPDKKN